MLVISSAALCSLASSCCVQPEHWNALVVDRDFLATLDERSSSRDVESHFHDLRALLVEGDADATRAVVRIVALGDPDGVFAESMNQLLPLAYENEFDFWNAVENVGPAGQQKILLWLDKLQAMHARLLDWGWPNSRVIEEHPALAGLRRDLSLGWWNGHSLPPGSLDSQSGAVSTP